MINDIINDIINDLIYTKKIYIQTYVYIIDLLNRRTGNSHARVEKLSPRLNLDSTSVISSTQGF